MKKDIEYKILTPSKMEVKYEGKKMLVTGEITIAPIFYADISSMKKWEPPYESIFITEFERDEIIEGITSKSKKTKIPVVFD